MKVRFEFFKGSSLIFTLGILIFLAATFSYGQSDWQVWQDASLPDFDTRLDELPETLCTPDFIVDVFPYSNTADLHGAGNDCPFRNGQEHIYKIYISEEGLYTFSLCSSPSSINSYIYLTTECCYGSVLASNNNGCQVYGRSQISCWRLNPGIYYLDVEPRDASGEDIYTLDVYSCPDPCPSTFPTDTTLDNGDGSFTWIQRTDENDEPPLYEGPWFDPTMPPSRDPYYGFEHYSWFHQDYGWKHIFPDFELPDGVCILSAEVHICAWDVDQHDCSIQHPEEPEECELDHVYGDGVLLNPEYLQGNNEVWSVTTFNISPATLLDDGTIDMFLNIDVWNDHLYWATTLNYAVLEVTYLLGEDCNRPPYTPLGYEWPPCIEDDDSLCIVITGPTPADPDTDDVTHQFRWFVRNEYTHGGFVDDENAPPHHRDHDGACIPADDSEIGDEWRVQAWAVDIHGTLSLEPLVITFPEIVPLCDDQNPIIGWDYGDLDSTEYPTQNEQNQGPANAIRLYNIAWFGETCTDDWPEPRCVDQDLDDGMIPADQIWPGCSEICVDITITTGPGYTGQLLYLNAWKDGNFNQDFNDILCEGTAPEQLIQDEEISGLAPNESVILRYCFTDPAIPEGGAKVMRFRLTHNPVGPGGYVGVDSILGETEDYILSSADYPLTVELVDVTIIPGEEQITLQWETASEQDNDHFDIARHTGTAPWQQVGSVLGAGSSAESQSYVFTDQYVMEGIPYYYRLTAVDIGGAREIIFETESPVTPFKPRIISYRLYANFPNPFNPTTSIIYDLKESGFVQLRVFDVLGRVAVELVNEHRKAGRHIVSFDGSPLPSGIYFFRLDAGEFSDTKKMILMK